MTSDKFFHHGGEKIQSLKNFTLSINLHDNGRKGRGQCHVLVRVVRSGAVCVMVTAE